MRFAVVHPKNARVLFYALFVLLPQKAGDSGPGGRMSMREGKVNAPEPEHPIRGTDKKHKR